MKKLFIPIVLVLIILACQKEPINVDDLYQSVETNSSAPAPKIDVCHYDSDEDSWHVINVSLNAWPAHEGHGDVRLDDLDNDGYVPDNECGFGDMGDCDDTNGDINPGMDEDCTNGIDDDCDGDIDEADDDCSTGLEG